MSNSIYVYGRLTDNPEMKQTQDGKIIANFTLADNHGKDKASFFRCSAFGKTAELISKCQKAHRLVVSGRMEEQKWTDQQTQQPRTGWNLIVNEMNYVEPAPQNNGQQPQQQYGTQPGYQQPPVGYPPQQGAYPPSAQQPYGVPQQQQYRAQPAQYGAQPPTTGAQYPPQQQYQQSPQPQQGNMFGQPPMQQQPAQQYQQPPAPGPRKPF